VKITSGNGKEGRERRIL